MNSLTVLNGNVVVNTENKNLKVKNIENIESWTDAFCNFAKVLHKGTTKGSLLIVNGVFSEIKSSPFMTLLSACTPIVLVCAGALGGKLTSCSSNWTSRTCGTASGSALFVPLLFGDCHVAHDPSVPQWIMLLTS
jgi:hypothetical protein